jgi:hypothetical protein
LCGISEHHLGKHLIPFPLFFLEVCPHFVVDNWIAGENGRIAGLLYQEMEKQGSGGQGIAWDPGDSGNTV